MRAWLQRLLGKKPSTIWVSHPIFLQHEPGRNHPEAPARISAISAELQQQGIWRKLWRLEGVGHSPLLEAPGAVNARVLDFFDAVEASRMAQP